MKTRTWILILAAAALLFAGLGLFLLQPSSDARSAEIYSQGALIRVLSLKKDQQLTVASPNGGVNVVTVKGGEIAVTEASCPDQVCRNRGFCSGGAPIICLPNELEIRFVGSSQPDISTH